MWDSDYSFFPFQQKRLICPNPALKFETSFIICQRNEIIAGEPMTEIDFYPNREDFSYSINDVDYEDLFYYPEILQAGKPTKSVLGQRVMARSCDANTNGLVFGGWIFSQMDIAGAAVAQKKTGGLVATVGVTDFTFEGKVYAGEVLSIYCEFMTSGRSSVRYNLIAYAEDCKVANSKRQIASGLFTFVALDAQGRKR